MGALDLNAGLLKQVDAAVGCAGYEERLAAFLGQTSDVERLEAIDIFFDIDQLQDTLFIDVAWHR